MLDNFAHATRGTYWRELHETAFVNSIVKVQHAH